MSNSNRKRQTETTASELSDRAAESVDRRYDATKETFSEHEVTEDRDDEDTGEED